MRTSALVALVFGAQALAAWAAPPGSGAPPTERAGSAVLEGRRVVLEKPTGGTAEIRYPIVRGARDRALRERIQAAIGLQAGTDRSLEEWRREIEVEGETWLAEIRYAVPYNGRSILNVVFTTSGVGSYPDSSQTSLVVDLGTGRPLRAEDVFRRTALEDLAERVDQKRQAQVRRTVEQRRRDFKPRPEDPEWTLQYLDHIAQQLEATRFEVEDLDHFTVGARGLTFFFDFGFPHVIEALEPPERYFLTWPELAPFVAPGGPFAAFIAGDP